MCTNTDGGTSRLFSVEEICEWNMFVSLFLYTSFLRTWLPIGINSNSNDHTKHVSTTKMVALGDLF